MANRRMYLVHRPTGRRMAIAKRSATAWESSDPALHVELSDFFEECFGDGDFAGQDDFVLEFED